MQCSALAEVPESAEWQLGHQILPGGWREAWGPPLSTGTGGVPAQRLRSNRTKEQDKVSSHHQ